ncbi:hypothetical protein HFO82_31745 [Rhizobium leguminosarum]|uniref:hypothetical protein n=1 Tax=Rhizobium leguminosarum TaxID=384 RepID=UPI0010389928|nr:hypothetical protein [Rhizobium leguminosarum]MBY5503148.1 hypothetical protein [Rhizobium leguminosarum]NKK31565.1 hypothetical protein [Rhizobium leguminosarum bv. viciae]TBZ45489.1 hypothetical protein E0H42_30500 [Rhizobium leguminosarum bv. viciae]
MKKTAAITAGIVATLSSCQTNAPAPSDPTSRVADAAHKCVQEIWNRDERKTTTGEITWNTDITVGLSYIEVGSDGNRPGGAWRACMKARGVDTSTLDLGDREMAPGRLADINMN